MNLQSENRRGNVNSPNAEWEALVRMLEDSLDTISRAFASPGASSESILSDVEGGIQRGYCALHNRRAIAETLRKHALVKKWDDIAKHAMLLASPTNRYEQIENTVAVFGQQLMDFLVTLRRAACSESGSEQKAADGRP